MIEMDELLPHVLDEVSVVKGEKSENHSGSYGYVFEVEIKNIVRIAKKPHTVLVSGVSDEQKRYLISKFKQECLLLSKLKHPNIVEFVGVYYGPGGEDDVTLVMEKLDCDLAAFLDNHPGIGELSKLLILRDVSCGLVYLHEHNPPIIHRDLTARNILLTQSRRAKIADVGVAKLMDEKTKQAEVLTQVPGQMYYMPPEACREDAVYTSKLDIFSFGHLSLHTILGKYPAVYEIEITQNILEEGTIQVWKRNSSLSKIGSEHYLFNSIVYCLLDNPDRRPTAREMYRVLTRSIRQSRQQSRPKGARANSVNERSMASKSQGNNSINKPRMRSSTGPVVSRSLPHLPPQNNATAAMPHNVLLSNPPGHIFPPPITPHNPLPPPPGSNLPPQRTPHGTITPPSRSKYSHPPPPPGRKHPLPSPPHPQTGSNLPPHIPPHSTLPPQWIDTTEEEFESKFQFHKDIPSPTKWRHGPKTYPSHYSGGRRRDITRIRFNQPPPPPPPR